MTKYRQEIVDKICDGIIKLKGRVGAVEEAGIHYQTFCFWYKNRKGFAEQIHKAEEKTEEKIKSVAIMSVVRAMQTQWCAGAWWLERKHWKEFANKQSVEMGGEIKNLHLYAIEVINKLNQDKPKKVTIDETDIPTLPD